MRLNLDANRRNTSTNSLEQQNGNRIRYGYIRRLEKHAGIVAKPDELGQQR